MQFNSQKNGDAPLRQNFISYEPYDYSYLGPHRFQIPTLNANSKSGHWTDKENAKYYAFLVRFQDKFTQKESRRHWKVFKSLAEFIKSRNPNQCRSHHHKMKKNYESIQQILDFLRRKQPGIQDKSQVYLKQLQNMEFSDFGNVSPEIKDQRNYPSFPAIAEKYSWVPDRNCKIQSNPYQDFSIGELGKVKDISKMKTNQDYKILEVKPQQNLGLLNFNNSPEEFPPTFGAFPTTGFLSMNPDQIFQEKNQAPFSSLNQFIPSARDFMKPEIPSMDNTDLHAKKVMQCHFYFNKWISAMEQLVQNNQNLYQNEQ